VAIAAVDSLAHAHRALHDGADPRTRGASTIDALAGALDHPDEDVAKAALLKLAAAEGGGDAPLARALTHPAAGVRSLAAEILAELRERGG